MVIYKVTAFIDMKETVQFFELLHLFSSIKEKIKTPISIFKLSKNNSKEYPFRLECGFHISRMEDYDSIESVFSKKFISMKIDVREERVE